MSAWAVLGAAALAGLVSIPHCAGMCGPIAACAGKHALRYQLGRLAGYAAAGVVCGASGQILATFLAGRWTSAISSWMLAVGLGLAAWRAWRAPARALVRLGRSRSLWDRAMAWAPAHPLVLGLITTLLPCGALASALLVAVGSGDWILGGVAMIVFALVSGSALALVSVLAARLRALSASPLASRLLAAVLLVGALLCVVRPIASLRETPSCHATGLVAVQR